MNVGKTVTSQLLKKGKVMTLRPFTLTIFVFGLLVWVYVVAIQITHPEWLTGQFSHIDFPPLDWRLDDVGIIAFAVSAFGFFIWQIEKSQSEE